MKGWNNLDTPIKHRPMPQSPGDGAERNKNMDERLKNIPEVEPDEIDQQMIKDAGAENDDEVIAFMEFLEKLNAMKESILDEQE